MTSNSLDLRHERCPMALLLAKRYSAELADGSQLVIKVSDQSSLQDIVKYLRSNEFTVECLTQEGYSTLKVSKKDAL